MDINSLLNIFFKSNNLWLHKRLMGLFIAVKGLMNGKILNLTSIGRSVTNKVHEKHNIKRIDRLLGNQYLYKEIILIRYLFKKYCLQLQLL